MATPVGDQEPLARELGAHAYIDSKKTPVAGAPREMGGADLILATAPSSQAISSTVEGAKPRRKLLMVAAPFEPLTVPAPSLLSGRPSSASVDRLEGHHGIQHAQRRPRQTEVFKLEEAEQAFGKVLQNQVCFCAVPVP
jgi:propanol-preferring alcohol dehydrogenase